MRWAIGLILLLGCLVGCSGRGDDTGSAEPPTSTATPLDTPSDAPAESGSDPTRGSPTGSPDAPSSRSTSADGPSTSPTKPPEPRKVRQRGIDASHHQGDIDWRAVAGDGIEFAYLKATEGTTFTDPRFARHRDAARAAGLEVGGYHYFQLCSPGVPQADHFASVLERLDGPRDLPGAIDLELAGSCAEPPAPDALLTEVRAFLERVQQRTGRRPVVYLYPEFEQRYGFADDLADHRQWVRSLDRRPERDWWIWQRSETGTVAGIDGPVDLNVRVVRRPAR